MIGKQTQTLCGQFEFKILYILDPKLKREKEKISKNCCTYKKLPNRLEIIGKMNSKLNVLILRM